MSVRIETEDELVGMLPEVAAGGDASEDGGDHAAEIVPGEGADDDIEVADVHTDEMGGSSLRLLRPYRSMLLVGVAMITALSALACWMGWNVYQIRQVADQRAIFLQTARQGAISLTTIDWRHAEADVQRILDSATGTFYDDFSQRSQPFLEVLKKAESTSEGTVTAAGLESMSTTEAQALIAVSVKTSNAAGPEQVPRSWRMRIAVQKIGDDVKISNVEFVL